jgi:uncharacterized membrane-anchored protein YitT (DUF2179 family)
MINLKKKAFNILIIILGNILLAIGIGIFILPFNIDAGGVSGISVILKRLFDPAIVILVVNWVLFFMGWIFLKNEFAIKTLLSTILYPSILNVIYHTNIIDLIKNDVNDPLLAALLGALLTGVGLGLIYRVGASSGGLDVVSLILNKYKGIKISKSTLILDLIIVMFGMFTVSIGSSLYGIIAVIITSYLIEMITIVGNSSYMMHIVSEKSSEINNYIINELNRGSSIIEIKGGINLDKKEMIEVIFNEKEYYKIKYNIEKIDKEAFISVYKAINVYGNGFNKLASK